MASDMSTQTEPALVSAPPSDKSVAARAANGMHRAVDSIAGAASSTLHAAAPAVERARSGAHHGIERLQMSTANPRQKFAAFGRRMEERRKIVVAQVRRFTVERPLTALAIALVAGVFLARIL